MNGDQSLYAARLLSGLADVNQSLMDASVRLRASAGVVRVNRGLDLRKYEGRVVAEIFLEVDCVGVSHCWWLDVAHGGDTWSLDLALLRTQDGEQRTLKQFPVREERSLEVFLDRLEEARQTLLKSISCFDFSRGPSPQPTGSP